MTASERDLLQELRAGGKRAMAMALARIEAAAAEPRTLDLLDAAYGGARAHVIGLTGPPGVGKSSLIASLVRRHRAADRTIGVIAVDPSSARSGGALLGDRARIDVDATDSGLFVRSMAARGQLGGLAALTPAAMVLMRAVYDLVIVETVGVGQSETAVTGVADSVVLCLQPSSGDSLQYLKAGIIEVPDLVVVTKADLGLPAERALADVEAALHVQGSGRQDGWLVPTLLVSAQAGVGLDALDQALAEHARVIADQGDLPGRRHAQAEGWISDALREEFGRFGLERAGRRSPGLTLRPGEAPFRRLRQLARDLRTVETLPAPTVRPRDRGATFF